MAGKKLDLKSIPKTRVKIFSIANRKGYAALCGLNLTEGATPLQTYQRMQKAVKRTGFGLPDLTAVQAKSLLKKNI